MAIFLKKGREKAVLAKHHWVFSGAIEKKDKIEDGNIVEVFSFEKQKLGEGYYNSQSSISVRMLSFGKQKAEEALKENIFSAKILREKFFDITQTNAYRIINAEGDGIPGLIVDKYDTVLILQIGTLGIEKLKEKILILLKENFPEIKSIYEKSSLPSRKEEGLKDFEGLLWGNPCDEIVIKEYGMQFGVDLKNGQKTGFFLDQREMRRLVEEHAKGKTLLNCFSYTGGFSVAAGRASAKRIDTVDISADAIERAKQNFSLNKLSLTKNNFVAADAFEYLRSMESNVYDFIILDPPAFAKKKTDVIQACRGYKDINRIALQKLQGPGLLLTCSCSHFVDEKLFQQVVFQAAQEAGRKVKILQKHHLAFDHPINLFHPEGEYLKSLLLYVE